MIGLCCRALANRLSQKKQLLSKPMPLADALKAEITPTKQGGLQHLNSYLINFKIKNRIYGKYSSHVIPFNAYTH